MDGGLDESPLATTVISEKQAAHWLLLLKSGGRAIIVVIVIAQGQSVTHPNGGRLRYSVSKV